MAPDEIKQRTDKTDNNDPDDGHSDILSEAIKMTATTPEARLVIEHANGAEYSLVTRSGDGQMLLLGDKLSKMKQGTKLGSRTAEVHKGSSLFIGSAGRGESKHPLGSHGPQPVLACSRPTEPGSRSSAQPLGPHRQGADRGRCRMRPAFHGSEVDGDAALARPSSLARRQTSCGG